MGARNKRWICGLVSVIALSILLGCEKNSISLFRSAATGGPRMVLEKGRKASHNKVLDVSFEDLNTTFTRMRLAEVSQFDDAKTLWIPFSANTQVDLGSTFAADGSKDNTKKVYAELSNNTNGILKLEAQILLDTVPPRASSGGLMASGLRGIIHKGGDRVPLEWNAFDVPSSVTGLFSGLDPDQAIRIGWSTRSSCDATSVTFVTEWMSNFNSYDAFPWPNFGPIDGFYICVIVQDAALNQFTLLSQPMTSLWQVIAGDNNSGNGGSATAHNVRFNYPSYLVTDSANNTYIFDSYANVLRKISSSGMISQIAGNGQIGVPKAGDALQTPLSGVGSTAIDSQDRIYLYVNGAIWRMILSADPTQAPQLQQWSAWLGGSTSMEIDRSSDTLYFSRLTTTRTTASDSYLYKIKISTIDQAFPSSATRPNLAYFKSNAVFAGNGLGLESAANFTTPNPTPASGSIDFPTTIAIGDAGEIYYATTTDGAGYQMGHGQIRMLKKDGNQVLQNYLLADGLYWIRQMQFVHLRPAGLPEQKFLLMGTFDRGFRKLNLLGSLPVLSATENVPKIDPYPSSSILHPLSVYGVTMRTKATAQGNTILSYLFTESDHSRVTVLNPDFTLSVNYGRPVYDGADTVATEAMVNNPYGLAQTVNGDVYFFETLSHILRKVSPSGEISLVAGTPGVRAAISNTTQYTLDQVKFDGFTFSYGYHYAMAYDPDLNTLFLSDGAYRAIRQINLTNKTLSTYGPTASWVYSSDPAVADGWPVFSLALPPQGSGSHDLFVNRYNTMNPLGDAIKRYSGSSGTHIGGTGVSGAVTPGIKATLSNLPAFTASAVDSQLNYYFSAGGVFKIDAASNLLTKLSSDSFTTMVLFEEADGSKHILGVKSNQLTHLLLNASGVNTAEVLCLPGTFLNSSRQIAKSNDGNLLIADTYNNRLLKYFVRDSAGQLKLQSGSCQE